MDKKNKIKKHAIGIILFISFISIGILFYIEWIHIFLLGGLIAWFLLWRKQQKNIYDESKRSNGNPKDDSNRRI